MCLMFSVLLSIWSDLICLVILVAMTKKKTLWNDKIWLYKIGDKYWETLEVYPFFDYYFFKHKKSCTRQHNHFGSSVNFYLENKLVQQYCFFFFPAFVMNWLNTKCKEDSVTTHLSDHTNIWHLHDILEHLSIKDDCSLLFFSTNFLSGTNVKERALSTQGKWLQ